MEPRRLILTNGDAAVARMRAARIGGEIVPWRDILNEGPVPAGLALEALSDVRAKFLSARGWITEQELQTAFSARDAMLRRHGDFDEIVLWFEHDLYDQLQLLQILDFFATEKRRDGVTLIQSGRYLGLETPQALKRHFHLAEPVTDAHLLLAQLAWNGFRSPTPEPWAAMLPVSTHVLPFLRLAMLRLLSELPHPRTGLSRTEATILQLIASGVRKPRELYAAFSEAEDALVVGDWSFFHLLDQMGGGGAPLLAGFSGLSFSPALPAPVRDAYLECSLSFTHLGYSCYAGTGNAMRQRSVKRPIGGYILDSNAPWYWDDASRTLTPPRAA
jgi:hypothetical protein